MQCVFSTSLITAELYTSEEWDYLALLKVLFFEAAVLANNINNQTLAEKCSTSREKDVTYVKICNHSWLFLLFFFDWPALH